MKPIIKVEKLGKEYTLGGRVERYRTLRDSLMSALRAPSRLLKGTSRKNREAIWALQDIDFEVKPGETLGIIGHNGAGKSTLLKILSRITEPSTGCVDLYGRVGSLLEVGTGFHAELTGRENIFLNGAILGMRRAEIQRKFDSIVAFAEVEQFLDTPVKHYSSGMYVRLAFAVAAHLEPEILLVDEVLAVGDVNFQKKCLGRMQDIAQEGRTVLFVSHNMGAVQGLCTRAIWLRKGRVEADGDVQTVVGDYLDACAQGFDNPLSHGGAGSGDLFLRKVLLRNGRGEATTDFTFGDNLEVEVHYHAKRRINLPYFWIGISSQFGSLLSANMLLDGARPKFVEGDGILRCVFKRLSLLPQTYTMTMGVRGENGSSHLVRCTEVGFFKITGTARELGLSGETADVHVWDSAPLVLPYEWHLPDGQNVAVDLLAKHLGK